MIGLLQKQKRQLMGVDLVRRCKAFLGEDVMLLLVGDARKGDDYELLLRERVSSANLQSNVLFMGQRSDVENVLALCDLVFVPSVEGLSLVGLEAMAAGAPLLANRAGGAGELVCTSGFGETFSDDDSIDDIALKACKIVRDGCAASELSRYDFLNRRNLDAYREEIGRCLVEVQGM